MANKIEIDNKIKQEYEKQFGAEIKYEYIFSSNI